MNYSTYRISLDIHKPDSNVVLNAKRGDTNRKIFISLTDGSVPYHISEECYAVFTATKPDGKIVYNECTIEDCVIIYKFTDQTVAAEGMMDCEIKLYGADNELITSPRFSIVVHDTVYDEGDEIESSDEFSALTKLVTDAQQAIDDANQAAEDANQAAEDANDAVKSINDIMLPGKIVKTVNGVAPDENGNVTVEVGGGSSDSGQNINPVAKTADMTQPVGVDADGRLWVAPIGGGTDEPDEPEVITHGIVWNLVNVTSSNPVASVNDGASLSAVLTPADGYTLGDVTVTMGGEVLTGVWDSSTATVTIPSVTGDVIISCMGAEPEPETIAVTFVAGGTDTATGIFSPGSVQSRVGNETLINATRNLTITFGESDLLVSSTADINLYILRYDTDGNYIGQVGLAGEEKTGNSYLLAHANNSYTMPAGYQYRLSIARTATAFGSNSDCRDYANSAITFVLGAKATAAETSVDGDYAQDYGIAPVSLTPDVTNNYLSNEFADAVIATRDAWMLEYKGDIDKIPVIIHTDQHGRLNKGLTLFSFLNDNLNWYEVSKIMNLGDTVTDRWTDADTEHPMTKCAELENYLDCYRKIPYSKRLDVFGNHDTWYTNPSGADAVVGEQARLSQYFKNIYARRTNNNGYFTVTDDYFNVKYVVLSCFEYTTSRSAYRISTAQMKWLIEELGKNDGYDVVLVAHVPLHYVTAEMTFPTGHTPTTTENYRVADVDMDELFAARKNKTSGTVTDSDGVSHSYDFAQCNTDVLCALHGHTHHDAYNYVGTDGLLSVSFDWFDGNTIHFALIDRANRQLNVWKVDNTNTVQNYQVPFDKPTA